MGLSRFRSFRTAQSTQSMAPAIQTSSKLPYWARDENDDQSQPSQPTATPVIRRKPVAGTNTSIAPAAQSISRKPVPTPSAAEPVLVYTPVEGNPYDTRTDSAQQWTASQFEHESPIRAAHVDVHEVVQQPEFSLSPAPQTAPAKKSKATGVLSRGFGTIRKAAGHAKRSLATSDEAKISTPLAGSFHRRGLNSPVVMETPLNLVGLDVAQADVPRYGMPDHLLSPRAVGPRSDSLSWLTNEPTPTQPTPAPAPPVAAPAPAAPVPKRSKSRKVVNDSDRETLFGDIIAAAQDSSWVEEAEAQAKGPARGNDKAKCNVGGIRASATMPPSFAIPAAGNPFARPHPPAVPASLRAPMQPANLDKSLPSSPAPGSMRRQTTVHKPVQASHQHTSGISEALEADGGRRASYVPGIKCSDCGKMIDAVQVADHRCGRRAAQAVDHESRATGLTRADTYRSNYGRPERLSPATTWGRGCMESISNVQGYETGFADDGDESDVVVDTFVRGDHTSWRGVVQSGVGSDVKSMRGHISGGLEEVRRSNEADAVNGCNGQWRGMS